jgi:hypothetical protein
MSGPDRPIQPENRLEAKRWLAIPTSKEENVKAALTFCLAVAFWFLSSGFGQTQPAASPTPTTKILAIGTVDPGADPAALRSILPTEVSETVKLYLDGKIDQWFSLQGRRGVVFILNMTDPAAAREMLEKLPLGQAHLMRFELMPLAPLNPLRQLLEMKPRSP